MLEGDVRGELVRIDLPVIRVWEVDPHTQQYTREIDLPFLPGSFAWGPGRPRPAGVGERLRSLVTVRARSGLCRSRERGLDQARRPVPGRGQGVPAGLGPGAGARRRPRRRADGPDPRPVQGARACPRRRDAFPTEDSQWFVTEKRFYRVGPRADARAPAVVTFAFVDRPELVEDFLKPPADDRQGRRRAVPLRRTRPASTDVYDWPLDGQEGKSVDAAGQRPDGHASPRSLEFPHPGARARSASWATIRSRSPMFKIRQGRRRADHPHGDGEPADGPERASRRTSEPDGGAQAAAGVDPLHGRRRSIDPKTNGRFGEIDVLAGPDETLYLPRLRPGQGGSGRAPLRRAGGQGQADRRLRRQSQHADDDQLRGRRLPPRGRSSRDICVPIDLPKGKMDQGIAACRLEMTVGGETKEIWLRRSPTLDQPRPEMLAVPRRRLRPGLRRRPQAARLRAEARRLRGRLRARDRAADQVREPGPAHRQVREHQGRAAHDLDEPPARPQRIHLLPDRATSPTSTRRPSGRRAGSSRSSRSPPTPAGRSSTPVACWWSWGLPSSST